MQVVRGQGGIIAAVMARLVGLPPSRSAAQVDVLNSGTTSSGTNMWHRSFDSTTLESKMEFRDGLMVESFWIGPLGLKMILHHLGSTSNPLSQKVQMQCITGAFGTLPKECGYVACLSPSPRLTADGTSIQVPTGEKTANNDSAHGWAVKVSLEAPWIGQLLSYDGEVFRN